MPPEFFADRCLGRGCPRFLVAWGWTVHILGDHFPDDGQHIGDPEWMAYGLSRGWSLLTQDERIATQPLARTWLREYRGVIHCLSNAQLKAEVKAEWFHTRLKVIYQRAVDRQTGFTSCMRLAFPDASASQASKAGGTMGRERRRDVDGRWPLTWGKPALFGRHIDYRRVLGVGSGSCRPGSPVDWLHQAQAATRWAGLSPTSARSLVWWAWVAIVVQPGRPSWQRRPSRSST